MNAYKILLVDDSEITRNILKKMSEPGFEILTANDGVDALEILFQQKIDLVVTDILMPNMDGYQLTYKIRTNEKLKNIPIIINTASAISQAEEKVALEMGANLYIRKSAAFQPLSAAIKQMLAEPQKFLHQAPNGAQSTRLMKEYSNKLVTRLEQSNLVLEEVKSNLQHSESRLKQAQALAQLGSWEVDLATNAAVWSDEMCRIYGLAPGANHQPAEAFLSFVYPDDLAHATKTINDSMTSLRNTSSYHRIIRKDGAIRYIHSERRFEFDAEGKPKDLYGISQDITRVKEMEMELQLSATNLRTIFDTTDVGFLFLTTSFAVVAFNKMCIHWAANIFGIDLKENTNFRELLLPGNRAGFDAFTAGILAGKAIHYETSYPKPGGMLMWFGVEGKPVIEDEKVTGISIAITDITQRREAEAKVYKISNINALMAQVNQNIVHIKNKNDLFKNACRIACDFGKFKIAWIGTLSQDDRTIKLVEQCGLPEAYVHLFANVPCRPGGPQDEVLRSGAYYVSNHIEHDTSLENWKEIANELGIHSCMWLAIKIAGKVTGTLNLYSDEHGFFDDERIALLAEVGRDISFALDMFKLDEKQKKAEDEIIALNETLEARVQARTVELSEANKALETFSYSVSHDLRAPVRAINGFSSIIQKEFGNQFTPRHKELFGFILDSNNRMGTLIDDLLALAKFGKEKLKPEPIAMDGLVKGIWASISRNNNHHAILELAELPELQADRSMMEQVVINLLSNAVKYSSKKEKPVVTVWSEQKNGRITFYFKDNGAGFDMQNAGKLFGVFERLHSQREFEGTGVGLLLVKNIIEKHGGTVRGEGKTGEGATFSFTLPVA